MELWDLYDENRRLLPGIMQRGDPQPAGTLHLVVHVCLFDEAGHMLIQHRQPFKKGWPGRWALTAGGSALAGDDSRAAAERETQEEIGLSLDLQGIHPSLTIHADDAFDDLYLLQCPVDVRLLTPQPEEVSELRWCSQQEIQQMLADSRFIPYPPALIDLLFALKHTPIQPTVGIK